MVPRQSWPIPRNVRVSRWETPHAKVQCTFWCIPHSTSNNNEEFKPEIDRLYSRYGRVSFIPKNSETAAFYLTLDLRFKSSNLDPTMTLSYQAILPNNSKVFKIVRSGEVSALKALIEDRKASLSDRDEDSRSLLNVSYVFHSFDSKMIKWEFSMHTTMARQTCAVFSLKMEQTRIAMSQLNQAVWGRFTNSLQIRIPLRYLAPYTHLWSWTITNH